MPRQARFVLAGVPYHVTQRGSRRQNVFFRDADRFQYLELLRLYSRRHSLKVLAYCLMPNHVHLIVVPSTSAALADTFRPLHSRYASWVNREKDWSGHLWQARFYAAALDDEYLHSATRYVERNPVRAGLVSHAEDYYWSSAGVHCRFETSDLLEDAAKWYLDVRPGQEWAEWLLSREEQAELDLIRQNSERGFPCGGDEFVVKLETESGLTFRPRPRGRPAKTQKLVSVTN